MTKVVGRRKSPWWRHAMMNKIVRCVPPDCRPEFREVLNALDPENPVAALIWLIREHKVEVLSRRQQLGGAGRHGMAGSGADGHGVARRGRQQTMKG